MVKFKVQDGVVSVARNYEYEVKRGSIEVEDADDINAFRASAGLEEVGAKAAARGEGEA